ncbi:MAG: response regulator [Segetibacter sp.]|nr:response regulator [Segetibacter sp.]
MAIKLNRVLLIDDDDVTNFLHKKVLMRTGIVRNIETVETAKEALDLLCENEVSGKPELIFLDVNMPGLTGWDFIDEYKAIKERYGIESTIILLTASANPDDEKKARDINEITEFLSKPLTDEMVNEIIKKYFPA